AARAAVPPDPAAPPPTPHYGTWGFDTSGMDRAVKPGTSFFDYANGDWIKRTQIPPDKTSYGAFDILADLSEARVHFILEDAARANAPIDTPQGKIGAMYRAFMNEAAIEQKGATPLKADLDEVRAVKSRDELAGLMGKSATGFQSAVFDMGISADDKTPTRYAVQVTQGGLGLPDRDYYIQPQFAEKKAAYQAYIARILTLAGWPDAQAQAPQVLAFESKIAEASWTRAEQRDPDKVYNPTTVADLDRAAPGFAWPQFFRAADLGQVSRVIAVTNTSLPKIAAIYAATPLETLKAWEAFHIASSAAPYLSSPFVQARFDFYSKTLGGQPQLPVRWKRAVRATNGALGEAVGEIYVAKYFPPESKAKMEQLIADLKSAYRVHIQNVDWMGPATKQEALKKLAAYDVQIGYPKKWKHYTFAVKPDDLYGDVERGMGWEWNYRVERLNQPVDKDEWDMFPQTVNAYNNPTFNEVVFPAAILQPPFFDPKADPAINYGAIGGVIGHEMTHGFDDQGRKYDSTGALRDWWTPQDAARFEAKAKVLGAHYSAMEPLPGLHIKGDLTMGENIADLGGLTLGYAAYHTSLNGKAAPVIGGFTGDQRVFLGWAQVWREKLRDDALRQQVTSNEHSPPVARVNGVVQDVDAWYKAYDIKPGDPLYLPPEQRVHIW
ncbi:MAG: peptidase M13, partial [Caulobacteraceae bacterium]|nr:peptidase M13 [Caulobacter sp.]